MLAGLDNGAIDVYTLSYSAEDDPAASFHFLERVNTVHEHDDGVTGLCAAGDGGAVVVSASLDRSLVAMDAATLARTREVRPAHRDAVADVAAAPGAGYPLVVTAGMDGRVAVWDLREGANDGKGKKLLFCP